MARQNGSMLIVALAVLALLSILAVTFAALMRLESQATANFSNRIRGEFVASSAESTLISMMRGGLNWNGYTDFRKQFSPWLYRDDTGNLAYGGLRELRDAAPEDTSLAVNMGSLSRGGGVGYFKTKIVDTSAQININSQQGNLGEIIDNLGVALRGDTDYKVNPLFTEARERGRLVTGREIVNYRDTLEGNRFESKTQLKIFIGEENFRIISDFLTTRSWIDPDTYRSADGITQTTDPEEAGNTGVINPNLTGLRTEVIGAARLVPEPRAPINVNTAPEPVLVAVLMGLGGRAAYPLVRIKDNPIEGDNRGEIDLGGGTLPPGREEQYLRPSPVWIHSEPLREDQARAIAKAIISRRKAQPFKEWRSGFGGNQAGLEEFFNSAVAENLLPNPNTMLVIDPDEPRNGATFKNALLFGGGPEYEKANADFNRGHPSIELSLRSQRGLPYASRNSWYWEMVRGVLTANFNPNSRINKYNPNATAYAPVDKFNLVKMSSHGQAGSTGGQPLPGHTIDFCFDANGIFEITTVADVALQGPDPARPLLPGERIAEVQRRSIVQIWEVQRHTTQRHFEKPFKAGPFSSANDREYVTSFPDAMLALHPDLYQGSAEDGRIELSGYVDALRDVMEPNQRETFFQGRSAVLTHHGFRYRTDQSANTLLRDARSGGSQAGSEYIAELSRVLDPEYTSEGHEFRRRYSSYTWNAKDSQAEEANIDDLVVDVAASGSDLYPDGVNGSSLRSSALGTRFLRFPASKYRVSPADVGEMRGNYSNNTGVMPYYRGGVAFWVKPEFDGNDPVFHGLLGATQVQWKVGQDLHEGSEGTQFYVYKNTDGMLRISRLYYHQAFQKGQTALPLPIFPEDGEEGAEEVEGVIDPRKAWARTDVVVDVSTWKAHEWHHLALSWNDEVGGNRIKVLIDFTDVGAVSHNLGEGQFVTLNEEEPRDGIFVGSFYRDQAVAGEGLFKFGTNWSKTDGALRNASIKRVSSNATIDEFATFEGDYVSPFGPIGYFTDKRGVYTNMFEIPFPVGIQRIRLRSIAWTIYAPVLYNSNPVQFDPNNVSFSVANVGQTGFTLQPLRDAGGDSRENTTFAGSWLYGRQSTSGDSTVGQLVYQVGMRGATGQNEYGARIVASPVLDDVTLSYYLPSARILLSETME